MSCRIYSITPVLLLVLLSFPILEASAQWRMISGTAIDIGSGGSDIWIIGGNNGIFRLNQGTFSWDQTEGEGDAIAVDRKGVPWIKNIQGDI